MSNYSCCDDSNLLATLWEIRSWAVREEEVTRNLTNIACLVGNQFFCDVCSIYRIDAVEQEIVLAATVGLRQDCVDKLRLKLGEGLCGSVAETQNPLMVEEHAMQHPQFQYCPESGEEPYESFLGVPIGLKERLAGVLVVQTTQPRVYSASEIRMLSLAADLIWPALVEEFSLPEPEWEPVAVENSST